MHQANQLGPARRVDVGVPQDDGTQPFVLVGDQVCHVATGAETHHEETFCPEVRLRQIHRGARVGDKLLAGRAPRTRAPAVAQAAHVESHSGDAHRGEVTGQQYVQSMRPDARNHAGIGQQGHGALLPHHG